ncbi:ATP-dependent Clp protease proteolytic subunit, partial [Francisella tularensis subsp. holarctica]|uniref:ATP-dependent Clp protease proteolytic subunit n=1 Tax=Francisella tularensis TaxID=263 RepID=UPI002381AAA3
GGAKGKRYSLPSSQIMIQQPLGGFRGQASHIEIHAKNILRIKDILNKVLAHHTVKDIETLVKDTDRYNFIMADESKAYG